MGNFGKVPLKETNNQSQAKSGTATKKLPGPTKSVQHNSTQGGGIFRATKGSPSK